MSSAEGAVTLIISSCLYIYIYIYTVQPVLSSHPVLSGHLDLLMHLMVLLIFGDPLIQSQDNEILTLGTL